MKQTLQRSLLVSLQNSTHVLLKTCLLKDERSDQLRFVDIQLYFYSFAKPNYQAAGGESWRVRALKGWSGSRINLSQSPNRRKAHSLKSRLNLPDFSESAKKRRESRRNRVHALKRSFLSLFI